VDEKGDGWTLQTSPKFRSAQFEHSMVITEGEPILLTC
jgi:methionyl aminopeptidase